MPSCWKSVWLLLVSFTSLLLPLKAQPDTTAAPLAAVRIHGLASPGKNFVRELRRLRSATEVQVRLQLWSLSAQAEGYLEARTEALIRRGDTLHAYLEPGPFYRYDSLRFPGLPAAALQEAGFDRWQRKQRPVDWSELRQGMQQVLDQYQQVGYPFASFDQTQLSYHRHGPDTLGLRLAYAFDPGPLVRIDSIRVQGNPREAPGFIYGLIKLRPGEPYAQQRIAEIPRILNNSIYYEEVAQPKVTFTPYQTALVDLKVKRKKAGKFDLLLGLLPPREPGQSFQFTGLVDVMLVSPLRQGEVFQLEFEKLTSSSQRLHLELGLPYLLRTPFQVNGRFDLLKQEEAFLNLEGALEAGYAFSPFLRAGLYSEVRSSRLLDSALVLENGAENTPQQLDGNRQVVGGEFYYENLDYRLNPRRGVRAQLRVGLGRREIVENVLLTRQDSNLYAGINQLQPLQEMSLELDTYFPLGGRHVLYAGNRSYWLGLESYFRNDQQQLGGARSIRGFNENQFFSDFYTFFSLEYRLLLERDSYLFVFGDYAWLRDQVRGRRQIQPYGTGLGMSYGTKAGIISVIYAIGGTQDLAFQPGRGRIHIGLVNPF
jgi:translocation and assembly module TamA